MEGRIASLNAAAAGTVVLYEALRQRRRDVAPPATQTPRPQPAEPALSSETDDLAETPELEDDVVIETDETDLPAHDVGPDDDEPIDDLVVEDGVVDAPVEPVPAVKTPRKTAAKKTVKKTTKKGAED
jgi:hypothetical protein